MKRIDEVRKYLQAKGDWAGPTEIGQKLGFSYNQASGKVNHCMKTLVRNGEVVRNPKGQYKWAG
jgi:hypothetical protein